MSTTQIARAALEDLMRRCREDGYDVQYSDLLALQSVLAAGPAQTLLNIRRRVREIEAILARSKSDYFNLGIEKPLKERAALEAEAAELRLMRYDIEFLENARNARVRMVRGELMKKRLADMGLQDLYDACHAEAEATVPPVEQTEVANG